MPFVWITLRLTWKFTTKFVDEDLALRIDTFIEFSFDDITY